jgi:hypothetical protein
MSPGQCSCPDCGTTLRVRDRSFIGRLIDCPECQVRLVIKLDDESNLVAEPPKREVEPHSPLVQRLAIPAARIRSAWGTKLAEFAHSPLVLAWALAIGVTTFAAILMLRPTVRFRTSSRDSSPSKEVTPQDHSPVVDDNQSSPPSNIEPGETIPSVTMPDPGTSVEQTPASDPPERPAAVVPSAETPDNAEAVAIQPAAPPTPVPAPVKVDVEALLAQRLQKFETSQPVTRKQIIELLEEMLGAPIQYDPEELGDKELERRISIDLETTTVGGVLKALTDAANWEFIVEGNGIRLRPRQVAGTPKK